MDTFRSLVYHPALTFLKYDGEHVGGPFMQSEDTPWRPVPVARPKILSAMFDQATSLGVPIAFGRRVVDYYELEETNRAGAILEDGGRVEGDLVIAADGVGSRAGRIITGKDMKSFSSGFSNYRASFPTEITYESDFLAREYAFKDGDPDYCQVFLGHATQMIILVSRDVTNYILNHEVCPLDHRLSLNC